MTSPESPPAEVALPTAKLTVFTDFWEGLASSTGASWIGVLLFALAEFVACCVYFTPARIAAANLSWLREGRGDDYVALSQNVLAYRVAKLEKLQVAYIGASQATNALTLPAQRNPDSLSPELSEAAGVPVEFRRFSTARQRREDALFISDQFPPSFRGVALLMVTDYQDDYEVVDNNDLDPMTEETRFSDRVLGVDAPSLVPIWAKRGVKKRRTGNFFMDHMVFFTARRMAGLWLPDHAPHLLNRMHEPDRLRKAWRRLNAREFFARVPILTTSRDVMVSFMDNMKARGVKVVLLEAPSNPMRDDLDTVGRLDAYRRAITQFAEEHDAEYWDLNEEADLRKTDFADAVHVGSASGRKRFQSLMIAHLGELIAKSFPNEPKGPAPAAQAAPAPMSPSRVTPDNDNDNDNDDGAD